jgi:uncharacterized phage protein gp47/JayE
MAVEIKSFNQILGSMVRKIMSETPVNDISTGSVLLSLLEACASNDFENNSAILNVLELLNVDAIKNNDLDAKAADYGLSRRTAVKAFGQVTIYNSNITKRSTSLYVIKPAPISGQTSLYVTSTAGWASSGTLYIGRGTESFEGPIAYTSIEVYPTYSKINLASALQKDHLISDVVVDSQGQPDRLISAGTVVKIPANSQSPEISFSVLRDAVIPAGEDSVRGVDIIAINAGSQGNAQINTITQFQAAPFTGATVTNPSSLSSGKDIETDTELRNRIKSYTITLARGTAPSIISSVIGVSDSDDNKQVASAVMTEPVKVGDPSILYIDDGSGFQPSYEGQSVDILLNNANGSEEFLQLANFPVTRPQLVNSGESPYTLLDSMQLKVVVDGEEEIITFPASKFENISSATISEVIIAINDQSVNFKARLTNSSKNILLYPVAHDAETIQVSAFKEGDVELLYANSVLKFPVNEISYISLYQNSTRLKEKTKTASIESVPYGQWNIDTVGNLIISVDGTPAQDRYFNINDFVDASSFSSLNLEQWVQAINLKFAGLTAISTPAQTLKIVSNKAGSKSNLTIQGGSYVNKMFAGKDLEVQGQDSQFQLNRQTGNIRILTDIASGDIITAGVEDAKGFAVSTPTNSGTYNVASDDVGRPADMVFVVDSTYCDVKTLPITVGTEITINDMGSSVMRVKSSSLNSFARLLPGDFLYIVKRTDWVDEDNCGLYKIVSKGDHTTAGVDSYVEVLNSNILDNDVVTVLDSNDIKAFRTDGYPQIWRGALVTTPGAEPLLGVVNSLNNNLLGVKAKIFRSNSIKITSAAEEGGSIAIPVSVGGAANLFSETSTNRVGNPSHVANKISDKELTGPFKRDTAVDTWLGRHTYSEIKANLSSNSTPSVPPYSSTYSETLNSASFSNSNISSADVVNFINGNNDGQTRSIKSLINASSIGTQQGVMRTELDHIAGDEVLFTDSLKFAADDSVVYIIDNDATNKTVDIKISRTAQVNSGSGLTSFAPTSTEFSANDIDNEPGIDFSNLNVWGQSLNKTDFSDYALLMRARNWYSTGGASGAGGKMILRANDYGSNGNKLRFNIKYPSFADQANSVVLKNTPSWSLLSYYFGSEANVVTGVSANDTIAVSGPYPDASTNFPNGATSSGNYYDYTFSGGSLVGAQVGNVLSLLDSSGVSTFNRGQFRINAISGNTVRVFNPNASTTSAGAPETTTVTTINDVVGTKTAVTIDVLASSVSQLDGKNIQIYDNKGMVNLWFDVDNNNISEPLFLPPPTRSIKVATIVSTDTIDQACAKIVDYLKNDQAFETVYSAGVSIVYTLAQNGPAPAPTHGTFPPLFSITNYPGLPDISIDKKYFTLYDDEGSVAVWYDVGNDGTIEPFHGANRSIRVETVSYGDTAAIIAAATAAAVNADSKFNAVVVGNAVTITTAFNANTQNASAGTSGFTVSNISGSSSGAEIISNPSQVQIFAINKNSIKDISEKINEGSILKISAVGSDALKIEKSTEEEDYSYTNNSTALGFGHNPGDENSSDHVKLHDGINWVKSFSNSNPNFTVKESFTLNGVAPSMYSMNSCSNEDGSVGEMIKLVPTTVKNVQHHLTQKALSQLPIVTNVDISNDGKRVQIKSKQLGSDGAIEVVGGRANKAESYIIGESGVSSDTTGSYLAVAIPAYPNTFSAGDIITLSNDKGVRRKSRLKETDSLDVEVLAANAKYLYKAKDINFNPATQIKIDDVSSSYSRPAGTVWRWTHNGTGGSLANVSAGDLLSAFGALSNWAQGNKTRLGGEGIVSGLPIINVNDAANWVDVINPNGKSMTFSPIGSGTVAVFPTPIIKWNLTHAARVKTNIISRSSNTITVDTASPHNLNSGDSVSIMDSSMLTDNTYGPIVVTDENSFTFNNPGTNATELSSKATILKSTLSVTKYKVEKISKNGLTRISRTSGNSPRFVDMGVAVDDYVVISGNTFDSNNNGRFRVLALDNDSFIIENVQSKSQLDTLTKLNNKGLQPTWTSNTNIVTGAAGTFKNLNVGDWIKKKEDSDDYYRQIVSINSSSDTATEITLGSSYPGLSGVAEGIAYDQENSYEGGISLDSIDDITFYEGDSVVVGDSLGIQNIVNPNWFSSQNIGTFEITEVGTDADTSAPYVKVKNEDAVEDSDVLMSVSVSGFYIIEGSLSKIETQRKIEHVAIDELNPDKKILYLSPANRSYKFSDTNLTKVSHTSKLNYSVGTIVGVDGYLYHTGLLRRVQRIVDGFEPDAENFPGRKAVGSFIETLPPLSKSVSMSIDIATNEGVNLGDISNGIKSTIINYINQLGVGEDIILSEIIAAVMQIKGVAAVTFTNPTPNTERIFVANNEKATILKENIGIA